jgi:hypothetical protein
MNNKKFGHELMWKAEHDKVLTKFNYGGRKKLQAAEISMNQRLMYDSVWGKRGRVVVISNDAKGCYYWIAHMIAYICM